MDFISQYLTYSASLWVCNLKFYIDFLYFLFLKIRWKYYEVDTHKTITVFMKQTFCYLMLCATSQSVNSKLYLVLATF